MEVYIELALVENFCMDFTLLYAAKAAVRNRAGARRIAFSAVLGALFAVIFPLIGAGGAFAAALKIAAGLALCLAAGRFEASSRRKKCKAYALFAGVFFALAALTGGALIALFWLCGWEYAAGEGYLISAVPAGIPLFCALVVLLGAKKLAKRLRRTDRAEAVCTITAGGKSVTLRAFFDSGNRVYAGGEPVSIIPLSAAEKIIDPAGITRSVKIHTVTGSRAIRVFAAEKMLIERDGRVTELKKVWLGVSEEPIASAVLHGDLAEG